MGRQSLRTRAARSSGASDLIQDRVAAVDAMNPAMRKKFKAVEQEINDARANNLRFYHQLGGICADIREKPDEYRGKNGESGFALLERALATQARTLRKAAAFFREYTVPQLTRLLGLYHTETKFQLHWGHVTYLLGISKIETREKLENEAVEKMWDPSALHSVIKRRSTGRGNQASAHGRTHVLPATVPAQVRQIASVSKTWLDKQQNVWNGDKVSAFANVMNLPPEEMDDEMLDTLVSMKETMEGIAAEAHENVNRVKRIIEHVRGCVERVKRDRDAAAAAEASANNVGRRNARSVDLDAPEVPAPRTTARRGRQPVGAK